MLLVPAFGPSTVRADTQPPFVTLAGRAVLPADTFAPGPPSGFAITGNTFGRKVPFPNQPVQGFSAILPKWNGNYLAMVDNGFGAKANSADSRLRWYEVQPNFATGAVKVIGYSELYDPNHLAGFPIVNETLDRVLTGADFDLESFRQMPDGTFWFGEEFGPFLLHTDITGKLIDRPIPLPIPAPLVPFAKGLPYVQSPDNPAFTGLSNQDARRVAANLPSSRGFEGMAMNLSATKLYPLLEGALVNDPVRTRLLMEEFDIATKHYTGRFWFYPMSDAGNSIGDMTAINDHEMLVIERDQGQGNDAHFKRVYKVDLNNVQPDGTLPKELVVDLMAITDTQGITHPEPGAIGLGHIFTFPFVTIEDIYPVDASTLLVVNDNNYPFSSGRRPGKDLDDNEFILLHLPTPLNLGTGPCGARQDCSGLVAQQTQMMHRMSGR
ncbi:MAG: esterase-like activity of phytase family protein [Herpetosiphonaceae bacterium]|nr:esterase-like activity of phytase family protein [Herpetosiphonaceae bacterium]